MIFGGFCVRNEPVATKFYTGKGDRGTSKMGKSEIDKGHLLFQVLGGLDELNSWLGFCRAGTVKTIKLKIVGSWLKEAQQGLFIAQAEVAAIGSGFKPKFKISQTKTTWLEKIINEIGDKLPPLTKFIIPGASEISSRIDVARVLARRVERNTKTLDKKVKLSPSLLQYLNRLSSFLFALARYVNWRLKLKEENPTYK